MKTNPLKIAASIGLTALLVGSVAAQESFSKPVGYETLTIADGFSYLGIRLHEPVVASGVTGEVNGATVTVPAAVTDALTEGTTYIFEVIDGDAEAAVVTVASFVSGSITLSDDLSDNLDVGANFSIRPSSTLASIFGAANESGLDKGFSGAAGADQVWIPDGMGGFDRYYFDELSPDSGDESWVDIATDLDVNPNTVPIIYTGGLITVGSAAVSNNTVVVSGAVKTTPTDFALVSGFNYVGTVSPAGATLASMFGVQNEAGLDLGFSGAAGADQIWIPSGNSFARYYFDELSPDSGNEAWVDIDTDLDVDPSTISLDSASGIIIINDGGPQGVIAQVPSFYSTL